MKRRMTFDPHCLVIARFNAVASAVGVSGDAVEAAAAAALLP